MNSNSSNKPVHSIRLGYINAAIWASKTEKGTFYNVTITRTYRNGDGEYASTDSFGRDDLPLVAKVADQAHTWIFAKLAE